jgi:hypothetical protein
VISDFEQRLANVLGQRLPAPFTGRARVAPAGPAGTQPVLLVGVTGATPAGREMGGSQRLEVVPGSPDQRRVLRLRFDVGLEVQPATGADRAQILAGLQAAAYALDTADVRDGSALREDGDQGFLVSQLAIKELVAPLNTLAVPPHVLRLAGEGWFWPIGLVGETGVPIAEVRVRSVALPIRLRPATPRLIAGGDAVDFTLAFPASRPLRLDADGVQPALPFGSVAVALAGPGGQPGAGALTGGTAGAPGVRLLSVVGNEAEFSYVPPAAAAQDELLIALDDGAGALGVPLARVALPVRAS